MERVHRTDREEFYAWAGEEAPQYFRAWATVYNERRAHMALGWKTPAGNNGGMGGIRGLAWALGGLVVGATLAFLVVAWDNSRKGVDALGRAYETVLPKEPTPVVEALPLYNPPRVSGGSGEAPRPLKPKETLSRSRKG